MSFPLEKITLAGRGLSSHQPRSGLRFRGNDGSLGFANWSIRDPFHGVHDPIAYVVNPSKAGTNPLTLILRVRYHSKLFSSCDFYTSAMSLEVLTPANQLTILRMIFIPVFVILLVYDYLGWAFASSFWLE